ncbi:MAG: ABC transporter ATP-binding protein [Cyclobacteriaceae bacterium]|nr:ABC transporter ATP-binding protein [Cyclobacteriaceae bacterium]UYN87738.1 MAG: ABC transporter ATP-binding protein [Cyclobacteriaceae bacterium]
MVTTKNLSFAYGNQKRIAFPDFSINKGEHCLLLGESGSGKTTLLHILGGLLRGYSGSVKVAGTELSSLSETALDHFRGKHMGFVFQRNHLISALTVEKNLILAPYLAELPIQHQQVDAVLGSLGIAEKKHSKVTELSQGQAQRVAIARAVFNNPPVILADEPTSALDDKSCAQVIDLLIHVANEHQATLLVATHDQRLQDKIEKQISLHG